MNEKDIQKMITDTYEESKEDTLFAMIRSFYSRKMLSVTILALGQQICYLVLAAVCAVGFFRTNEIKYQLMFSAGFICFVQLCWLQSIWAWQLTHRHSIKREIKRLEIRVAELNETVKGR